MNAFHNGQARKFMIITSVIWAGIISLALPQSFYSVFTSYRMTTTVERDIYFSYDELTAVFQI